VIVYSNSDSYGIISDGKVYSNFIADYYNANLINIGKAGSCNSRIVRTTTRDLLSIRSTDEEILVLISLASLWRNEYWSAKNHNPTENDGHFQSFQISSLNSNQFNHVDKESKEFAKAWYRQINYEQLMTDLYVNLVLLTTFLKTNNFKYLIWAGSKDYKTIDFTAPFIKDFADNLSKTNLIPISEFNFCDYCLEQEFTPIDSDQYGIYGHHGELAHKKFAEYLIENYLNEI